MGIKFQIGDKVERIAGDHCKMCVGNISQVIGLVHDGDLELLDFEGTHAAYNFKLYEEKQMFDMKKDKWFIRTPNPEISEAVQLWLFEQGLQWCGASYTNVAHTNSLVLMWTENNKFVWCDELDSDYKEIKLTFKTSVASVEYPIIESQAEKELKALEQKIQELTEQASKLRSAIK